MMTLVNKLKKISQRNKDLSFGYLRENEDKSKSNYPQLIKYLVLMYSNAQDQFDRNAAHPSTQIDGNCIMHTEDDAYFTTYLKNVVTEGIHQWKFRFEDDVGFHCGSIGIGKATSITEHADGSIDNRKCNGTCTGYQISMNGQKTHPNNTWFNDKGFASEVQNGDIVEVMLDFNKLMVIFKINEIAKVEFHDIENVPYRAGVSMWRKGMGFTLISYQDIYK